jgi:hypothetical protein
VAAEKLQKGKHISTTKPSSMFEGLSKNADYPASASYTDKISLKMVYSVLYAAIELG